MSLVENLAKDLPGDPNQALYEFAKRVSDGFERKAPAAKPEDYHNILKLMYSFAHQFDIEIQWPHVIGDDGRTTYETARAVLMQLHDRGCRIER